MYRILMLCKDTAVVSPLIQAYFKENTRESLEAYVVGVEIAELQGEVANFIKNMGVSLEAIGHYEIQDFQDKAFDYILTFDKESEEYSHHLPSHSVKYHYNPGMGKLVDKGVAKLYDTLGKLLDEFIHEHF